MFGGKIGVTELFIILVVVVLIVKSSRSRSFAGVLLGLILGGFVGFILRPSVAIVGQLPFETVITRGSNLTGMNIILRSAAEQSFNFMMAGAIVGAVILGIWGSLTTKPKQQTASVQSVAAAASQSSTTHAAVETAFCTKCGKALSADTLFCGSCGARRS